MGFQHTEQLRLHFERHLGHFIQKQSPLLAKRKCPGLSRTAPVNEPRTWPKQLAFQQARGQRSAAYRVKRPLAGES